MDVPPKLSAQVRVFATGNGRKTDPVDARSVALAALYAPADPGLRPVTVDDELMVMGLLVDRRDELGRARTQTINRLHRLLLEPFPGGAKQFLVRAAGPGPDRNHQATGLVGKTRRRLAVELVTVPRGDRPQDQDRREGPGRAGHRARLNPDGADRDRAHGRRAAAGRCRRHPPLPRQGPVRVLERHRTSGRLLWSLSSGTGCPGREPQDQPDAAHHGRRTAAQSHSRPGVLRRQKGRRQTLNDGHARPQTSSVQRRVYARMLADQNRRDHASATGPGGHLGNGSDSSATGSQPNAGSSDKPLPGPATSKPRTLVPAVS